MFTIKALNIDLAIDSSHIKHNDDLVGYVIQNYPHKVVKASILTRLSIDSWYSEAIAKYPQDRHTFLLGTVSLVGEVRGTSDISKGVHEYNGGSVSKDPKAN